MTEQPHREVAVLNAALELRPAERAAYLDQVCAGDAALRQQVEALLQAHEQAEDFLEAPPAGFHFKRTTPVNNALTERPGDKIGRYKLLQQIGEGGCGVVYMAEQEEPVRRRVALKVIKLGMDTKQVIARFEAERQALALMDHPNIAKVLDAGATETGRPYFVMELVRGVKITDFCDENKVSTEDRLKLFIQICQAIQHAHQKGVIHRDIKPSNILVTINDGVPVPKVIDFGIAKATAGRLTNQTLFTAFEQFLGTPAYMSPEQAVMTSLDIDTRSDIYSLGVLLYELLTGGTPFDQKELLAAGLDEMRRTIREVEPVKPSTRLTQELAAIAAREPAKVRKWESEKVGEDAHLKADSHSPTFSPAHFRSRLRLDPHELHRLIPLLRGDLDWIVMKCLEKDRARRYETANGLAADVNRHLNSEPIVARPPSGLYRFQKLVQRNRFAFAAVGAVVMTILLALVVLAVSNLRITRERNQKQIALGEKVAALATAEASEQRARDGLFAALKSQAQVRRFSRQMGQRLDSLEAVAEASRIRHDPSLADDAVAAMALADIRLGPVRKSGGNNSFALAFDASFERCAFLDDQGLITVRSVLDDRELQRLTVTAPAGSDPGQHSLSFSPDGQLLGYVRSGSRPYVWRMADAQEILHDPPRDGSQVVFSQDSRQLLLDDNHWILSFDPVTGRERRRWRANDTVSVLAFAPDNRRFAASYVNHETVSVFDLFTADKLADLPVRPGLAHTLCWHPDGQHLAMGGTDPTIQIWNLERRRKVATLTGHSPVITDLAFHPGGNLLASGSWDGTVRLWETASARQIMQLPISGALQFGADARWLGVIHRAGDQVQLLEVTPPRECRTIVSSLGAGQGAYLCCAVSPDNQLLAVGMADGVRLWNVFSHRELALLEIGSTLSVAFTADSRALFTCGTNGVKHWPIVPAGADATELSLGPPQNLRLPFRPHRLALNRDGRTLGVMSEADGQAAVLDLETAGVRGPLMMHSNVSFVALSPDALWLATSGWHSDRVRLWDAQTGKLTWEKVVGNICMVFFTPDSRQLIIAKGGEFTFFDFNTFDLSLRLPREPGLYPGDIAFTADGKLMAMEMSPAVIHLKEVATGKTIAKLEDPFADRSTWMTFTPDAAKLIVVATYADAVHVWDLRAIRSRLKGMGLDWDWPELPPVKESPVSARSRPLKVEVISTDAR